MKSCPKFLGDEHDWISFGDHRSLLFFYLVTPFFWRLGYNAPLSAVLAVAIPPSFFPF